MNTDKIFAEAIANEYSVKNASRVIALKKLDHRAKLPANIAAYSLGIVSALELGVGMCLSMRVIGSGKTIVPFTVHGGSGFSGIIGTIADLQPGAAVVEDGLSISRNSVAQAQGDVADWVAGLDLDR